jgi:hypothetical protein
MVGSVEYENLYPEQVISIPEGNLDNYLDAGFAWVGWCKP